MGQLAETARDAWYAWHWDTPTALWVAWMAFTLGAFAALEYLTSWASPIEAWRGNMLTHHWRPLIQTTDIAWFLGAGLWLGFVLWFTKHFFIDQMDFVDVFNL